MLERSSGGAGMVCETSSRVRPLPVNRRGGFLDDPFFQDAWDDYHNAVRRIVDRFNHGFFNNPRDRLRDSQYHSMYRTLRSARNNVTQQTAKFKDEGDFYKLVMDVHEFVGGEVTVRTSGGCVSVRGRLEEGGGPVGGDADSESSKTSNISNKTLHRRFTLPPDADGEKVVSTLSKDAVLTVTIPKRSDVRVIPVTFEKDSSSDASSGRSGIKRHSITQPDLGPTPSKRTQEYKESSLSPNRQKRGSESPDKEKKRENQNQKNSNGEVNVEIVREDMGRKRERNRKKKEEESSQASIVDEDEVQERRERRRKSVNERNKQSNDLVQKVEKRSSGKVNKQGSNNDILDNQEKQGTTSHQQENKEDLNRRRKSDSQVSNRKNEKRRSEGAVREFNIPIHIEGESDSSNQVNASQNTNMEAKDNTCNGPSQNEGKNNTQSIDSKELQKEVPMTKDSEPSNKNDKKPRKLPTFSFNNIQGLKTEKENIKPSTKDPPWVYSTVYQDDTDTKVCDESPVTKLENVPYSNKSGPDEILPSKNSIKDLPSSDLKITDVLKRIKEKNIKICKDASEICDEIDKNERLKSFSYEDVKDNNTPKHKSSNESLVHNDSHSQRTPTLDDKESPNSSPNNLESQDNNQSKQESATKESPKIGRVIPIAHKQEHQEEDMFKDCWKNFSSTLQDVLSRLQELSSDLGESRLMTSQEDGGQNQTTTEENKAVERKLGSAAVGVGAPTVGQPTDHGPLPPTCTGQQHHGPVYDTNTRSTPTPPPRSGPGGGGALTQPTNALTRDDRAGWLGDDGAHGQAVGQDTSPQVAPFRLSDGVPDVPRWRGGGGGGGVTTEPRPRPASVALQPLVDSSSVVSGSPRPRPRPTSLLLQEHTPQESVIKDVSQEAQSFSGPRSVRSQQASLNGGVPGAGSLINSLRKGSPVEALKDSFLTRLTPPEGAATGVYIPVEYDASDAATTSSRPLTGDTCAAAGGDLQSVVGNPIQRAPRVSSDSPTPTSTPKAWAPLYSLSTEQDTDRDTHPCVRPVADPYTGVGYPSPPTQPQQPRSPPTRGHHQTLGSRGPSPPIRGQHQALSSPTDDAAVDDLLAKAHRVIEETRKLTQSGGGPGPSDTLNGFSADNRRRGASPPDPLGHEPSTECINLTEEVDSGKSKRELKDYSVYDQLKSDSGVCESRTDQGRQSRPRHTDHLRREGRGRAASSGAVLPHVQQAQSQVHSDGRDVIDTELHQDSVNGAEIGSAGDVTMGTAKRGVSGGGSVGPAPAATTPPQVGPSEHTGRPRQTRSAATRTTRAGDQQGGPSKSRDLAGSMGGSFSVGRARTTSPAARTARGTPSSSPASTPGTFTARAAQRLHEGSTSGTREDKPPPPFARPPQGTKVDSTKRYSGFGNIGSGNVGKMRDLWGSRQEKTKPPTPASTPPFVRKASGASESPRSPRKSTPRATTPTRDSPKPRVDSPGPRDSSSRRGSTSSTRAASPGPTSGRRRGSSGNTAADSAPRTYAPASSTSHNKSSERRRDSQSSPDKYNRRDSQSSPDKHNRRDSQSSPDKYNRRDSQSSPDKYSPGRGLGGHYSSSKKAPKERSEPREPPQPTTFHQKLFKKLRDSSLQPDSETICFKESNGKYKLVMDVEAYVPGEVEVLQDDKVLTVKGRVELATSDGGSTIRTFHRTFHIPNSAKEEDIDSALSQDGYLTVFVPKKRERVIKIELTD